MNKMRAPLSGAVRITALAAFLTFLFYGSLHAYLDPGTGSYILQLLIAGIASALLAIKIFWQNIKAFFRNLFRRGKKGGK